MKLKKMVVCITKKDIKNFLKLQDKINISDIFINDDLRLILDNFLNGGKTTEFGTVMPL